MQYEGASEGETHEGWQSLISKLRRIATKRCRRQDAEDLVSEAVLETILASRRYANTDYPTQSIEALGVAILKRLSQRTWRRSRLRVENADTLDTLPSPQPCLEQANCVPSEILLSIALPNLGRRQRILIQAMREGHSFQWVADQIKTTVPEVRRMARDLERRIQNSVRQFP